MFHFYAEVSSFKNKKQKVYSNEHLVADLLLPLAMQTYNPTDTAN